ncbi:palmitoyltransferase swf1 [Grosmannia clavigera kw1407]|uniref:Palmitoyltransferase n=1 Tax=Grosmannia clavigera (strain kw1407 / UAMH 11150) TaxID=655863 RepID=F0X9U0_GROCL|nr:palmitoyltransferase swf1 [Grosmannia clavigera kw1407]EFX05826.1 palmitoyltransferase swf1 [Grosmannia clavigera kw1407]
MAMGTVGTIVTVILGISFMVFVAFFGRLPTFRHTPIAWLHRLFLVHLPGGVLALDRGLTGGRLSRSLRRFGSFMMNDKHPTVLIFFVLLLGVSEWLAVPTAWRLMGGLQRATLAVLAVLPYVFLWLAAFSDPGTVSLGVLRVQLLAYPYDYALFYPGMRCRTCNLLKPPRSKHCSVCKRCIARLDHHCIFINNCVGAGNQHWFLLLLLNTALLTSFGGLVGAGLIAGRTARQFPSWSVLPWRARHVAGDGRPMDLQDWLLLWSWGMRDLVQLGSVSLLALLLSPLVWGLLAYNVWNVATGQTTNESLKWADWRDDMAAGLVYRRRLSRERGNQGNRDGVPVSLADTASLTRWPLEPEHVIICADDDGKPPSASDPSLPGVGEWEQVWRLRDVENIYDIGVCRNFTDVFVPDYNFNTSGLPSVEARGRSRRRPMGK